MTEIHQVTPFLRFSNGTTESRSTAIALEAEVALSVNGEAWLSFRCSPDNLEGLAAGFLYNGSFIETAGEIAALDICETRDHIDAWLKHAVTKPTAWSRTSGCQGGMIQAGPASIPPLDRALRYPIAALFGQVDAFLTRLNSPGFPQYGVHTTLLLDKNEPVLICNDIGRHNTLDKIAGDCLLKPILLSEPVLITTGRISSEMVYKTARMKVPLAVSLHSVSQMALQAAEALGITLVGHARRSQVDIYTHPENLIYA